MINYKRIPVIFSSIVFLLLFIFQSSPQAREIKGKKESSFVVEDVSDKKTDRENDDSKTHTIMVTADKTKKNNQEIPISTTVISGEMLEDANIKNTNELTRFAPNVYFKKSTSENVISMRGVTSFDTSVYSPTAVYVNDLLLPLHYSHLIDLMDIERVEILRGPQGSLYGGNSLAGVINIITRQPDNEARIKLAGDMGAFTSTDDYPQQYNMGLSAVTPVIRDKLYIGISGRFEKGDGYITNKYNDNDNAAEIERASAQAVLRWTPNTRFDISLTGDILHNDDRIEVYRFDTGPYRSDPHKVNLDTKNFQKEKGNSQNLRVAYSGDSMDFLSVTGIRYYHNKNQQDYDCTADPMNNWGATLAHYKDNYISQELRLSSADKKSPFVWLTGMYGFWEETTIEQTNSVTALDNTTTIDNAGYALFGQGTYTLFKQLHLTAGLRYDIRKTEGEKENDTLDISDTNNSAEVLPKFSIGYDITATKFLYFTISKGYMAGGYNYAEATNNESFCYDPEYSWNYELGIKTGWLDNRLIANLSIFYSKIKDKQVADYSNWVMNIENAAEAHSTGAELEVQAMPVKEIKILIGLGYTSAKFDDWTATEYNSDYTALIEKDYSDKNIPNVPEYTCNLGIQYMHQTGLFIRTDANIIGPVYADNDNKFKEDPYLLLNIQLGYKTDMYDIILWGKNITDTEYHTIAYDYGEEKLVQDGEPASFGFRCILRI